MIDTGLANEERTGQSRQREQNRRRQGQPGDIEGIRNRLRRALWPTEYIPKAGAADYLLMGGTIPLCRK
jgi:hypothetical protein